MARTMKLLMMVVLGGVMFISAGCEDKACKESLAKANALKTEALKAGEDLNNEVIALKAKLAVAEKDLADAQKAVSDAKEAAVKPDAKPSKMKGKKGKKKR